MNLDDWQDWLRKTHNNFALLVNTLLEKEGLTPYALAKRLKGMVSQRSVYDFLEGKDVRMKTLLAILDVCELRIDVAWRYHIPHRDFRVYTKEKLLAELKKMEEQRSVDGWLNGWKKTYQPHLARKWKWEENMRKQRSHNPTSTRRTTG